MRATVFDAIAKRGAVQANLWFLTGDLGFGQTDAIAESLGSRYLNVGIGEQNLMSVAAGLGLAGQRVIAYSIGAFGLLRGIEQLRAGAVTHRLDVTVVCGGAGLSYGTLGFSHFALEDLAILRAVPYIKILVPTTATELAVACDDILDGSGPKYLRLERSVCDGDIFSLSQSPVMASYDAVVVGYGSVMSEAVEAARRLAAEGCRAGLLSVPSIDHQTSELLAMALARVPVIVTVEEHSIRGGIGSLVAETLATGGLRSRFGMLGTDDSVVECWGGFKFLRQHQRLDADAIVSTVRRLRAL